eukprot:jgi/Bigna1/81802/fgenesh1_pg.84_\
MARGQRSLTAPQFLDLLLVRECQASHHSVTAYTEWLQPRNENMIWLGNAGKEGAEPENTYFALDVSSIPSFDEQRMPSGARLLSPRTLASSVESEFNAAVMATAVGKGLWHQVNRFCTRCGSRTESRNSGSSRKCTNPECAKSVFPRIDPAVIVLLSSKDRQHCLLGRQSRWVKGRYSCLAGFVEVGETLEDAIIREVKEEAGVRVKRDSIQYVGSQPWPFPQSLMLGFHAEVEEREGGGLAEIMVDENELEHAQWVSRAQMQRCVKEMAEGHVSEKLSIPGSYALAYNLINEWLKGQ